MKNDQLHVSSSSVMITGVSSGIGYATAAEFLDHEFHVFGSVRNQADADRLKETFGQNFFPLIFDVRDPGAIGSAAEQVGKILNGQTLSGLVNNAGIAVSGPLMHISPEEFSDQLNVSVTGVLRVIRAFLPLLGARSGFEGQPGRIVNISSVNGRIAFPFIGPYTAAKHALEALSDVLRRELMLYKIDVIVIEPGNTATPIWEKAKATPEFADTDYAEIVRFLRKSVFDHAGEDAIDPREVGRSIRLAVTLPNPRSRYLILRHKITGWYLIRIIPDRWLDRIIARRIGMI
jgi:NAD(P)-dependent dehydrogenase (short-subunit alcohol dehydrogenase family)